jgi:HAD superfamily phosphoserine phosphatase-like hydrolase
MRRRIAPTVAAFFDLDGTLVAFPSLEVRFFRALRYQRRIGVRSYFLWLGEALRLAPGGINRIAHANKMYLRGAQAVDEHGDAGIFACPTTEETEGKTRENGEPRKGEERKGRARTPVAPFFAEGIKRVAWHARRGHAIVLVSGTLQHLAQAASFDLQLRLGEVGIAAPIGVCATRLESLEGKWTGRIVGDVMFGEEKARAVKRFAEASGVDLTECFAYGDSASDRWMLEAVGRPAAVNPSNDLGRIARGNGWPVFRWVEERNFTQSSPRTWRAQSSEATL